MRSTNKLLLLGVSVLAVAGCATDTTTDTLPMEGRVVEVLGDNPGCAEAAAVLGRDLGRYDVKLEPPVTGVYQLDGINTVSFVTADGVYFDWAATVGIDAVIVKGGPDAAVYLYDPEAFGDAGLSAPINPNNGTPYALSHVSFCYDYELAVAKTAVPSFNRTYTWSIDKLAPADALTLAAGEVYAMPYTVEVARTGAVDSDWQVRGEVVIANPSPFAAQVVGIADELAGAPLAVTCPEAPPFELPPWASVTCTYEVALGGPEAGVNHVVVETVGDVAGGEATAAFDFAGADVREYDTCVTVTDDHAGELGAACEERTFAYVLDLGPYEACGATETFVNTAVAVADDTGASWSDDWTVTVTIPPCEVGCTLTQGYWKTHAGDRSPPFDDAWLALPAGPATPFFAADASYLEVLWTPPAGNAYYVLAHQYVAAVLNGANGASTADVAAALDEARALFEAYAPADLARVRGKSAVATRMTQLAAILDAYNNGLTGPGHCDESTPPPT